MRPARPGDGIRADTHKTENANGALLGVNIGGEKFVGLGSILKNPAYRDNSSAEHDATLDLLHGS